MCLLDPYCPHPIYQALDAKFPTELILVPLASLLLPLCQDEDSFLEAYGDIAFYKRSSIS